MERMKHLAVAAVLLLSAGPLRADENVDYLRDIKPILKARCFACHGALKQKGKLRLDTAELMRKGGRHGPAVVAGDPARSLLVERVLDKEESSRMPAEGKPLSERQIALLKAWISQGAKAPAGEKAEADPRSHWAFRKPVRPGVPKIAVPDWGRNPIDAFLAQEHGRRGLKPNGPAERHVLLRRVYLDLIGLPPTRKELHAFLADSSADAYEKVVDRLLASPQYAERWARHWMDVWRYSDWYGRRAVSDVLFSYPMIWRWRDWIVRSIDQDKGYDRMIEEMLAADEIAPTDDAILPATGFIVRNCFRWNYNQWMKDMVEHTGKAFLGLTLNCCHCHDHKYDPISQEEYFKFRAFFEPLELRHDRVPGEPDPGPHQKYVYGQVSKPIQSGMVRVFDERLDAKTFMYSGGDHRNVIKGKPPIPPGVPDILGGEGFKVEPVTLPPSASYPGLKPFVQKEEIAKREKEVAATEKAFQAARANSAREEGGLRIAEIQLQAARSELAAIKVRIAADLARYMNHDEPRATQQAKAASKAERQARLDNALVAQAKAEEALAAARRRATADPKGKAEAAQKEKQLAAAVQAVKNLRAALAGDSVAYTPLSPSYPSKSSGRRTALACWLASKENPLTARVAVNYIWAWHFGKPIVPTTFDFGRNGKPPSHPELLDWLAVEFMANGWHMKPIHRLIVTSSAYRMRSTPGKDNPNLALDRDNRFLWHYPVGRMEAEVVRDSILYVAGELDLAQGGPEIPHEQGLTSRRRSIYFAHHGEARMQFLELFDAASACDAYKRTMSVLPQQALALGNSELSLRQGRFLARRLWDDIQKEKSPRQNSEDTFIAAVFEQVLCRSPSAAEKAASAAFLARQMKLFRDSGLKGTIPSPNDGPATEPAMRARENLVHALLNHNDFVTIR
jgi:hypothetical protein